MGQARRDPTPSGLLVYSELHHKREGFSGGNGALMRISPLPLGYLHEEEQGDGQPSGRGPSDLAQDVRTIAQLTHWEDDNGDACVLWAFAIRHAIITGELNAKAGLPMVSESSRSRWEVLIDEACDPARHPRDFCQDSEGRRNGWVVLSMQSALSAVSGATGLIDALQRAIRGGGDADTVAAIAGGLAGAIYGTSEIPEGWWTEVHGWPGYTLRELVDLARRAMVAR